MLDEILESYEMRTRDAERERDMYKTAFHKALYIIISNAKKNHCKGCPLKDSGLIKSQNSCNNRLKAYFMPDNRCSKDEVPPPPPSKI